MATQTVSNARLTVDNFTPISVNDTVSFRGATLTVSSKSYTNDVDLICTIELSDADGRVRGRLIKVVSASDPGYADACTAVGA